jgi:hypothetical protein
MVFLGDLLSLVVSRRPWAISGREVHGGKPRFPSVSFTGRFIGTRPTGFTTGTAVIDSEYVS